MSNKIIEEQRRVREEKINMIKAKQGLIEPEKVDEAAVVIPKTPKEKLLNYWYHFKWHTIGGLALIIVLAVMIVQCASRESVDFMVVLYADYPVDSGRIEKIEEYIEQFAEDIDGNGKITVEVVNCSFSDEQSKQTAVSKLQSMIAAEPKAILYIANKKTINDLNALNEKGFFEEAPVLLTQEFYDYCAGDGILDKLPEELKIGYRRIGDTLMEKDETAQKIQANCEKIYNEMVEKYEKSIVNTEPKQ